MFNNLTVIFSTFAGSKTLLFMEPAFITASQLPYSPPLKRAKKSENKSLIEAEKIPSGDENAISLMEESQKSGVVNREANPVIPNLFLLMIRKNFIFLFILITGWLQVCADEGMWIINELNAKSQARLAELGFTPDYQFIYDKDSPSLSHAVVIFGGGCTGITVSEEGLIFTNHHCGYGSIQKLSSVENNYLQDGFVSHNKTEELPVEGLSVRYLLNIVDVSDRIIPQVASIDNEKNRLRAIDSICAAMKKSMVESKFLSSDIVPFYSRNKYYLVTYKVYRDVRLVFAPPTSMGKFGGDTDNWMWPRHTCDFSVFRVYADVNNQPAEFDEGNRPYCPAYFAEISLQGYQPNDFAMTIGFPGSTDRYLTSFGVRQRIESINKPRIEVRGIKQDIWQKAMQSDEAVRIQYASKYAGSSNYWKNSIGMNRGLAKLHVLDRKQVEESIFEQWAQAPENKPVYGQVMSMLREGYTSIDDQRKNLTYLNEAFTSGAEILQLMRLFGQIDRKDLSIIDIENILRDKIRPFFKDYYPAMDQLVLAAMMQIVKQRVPKEYLPAIFANIDKKYKGDYERYAADLFSKTALLSENKLVKLLQDKKKYDRFLKKDPASILSSSVTTVVTPLRQSITDAELTINQGKRLHFAGLQQLYPDNNFYSDANSTMRLSYGSINGYYPFDAAWYNHYSTDKGLLEKEDSTHHEFILQPEIIDLIRTRDFGVYANEKGELQLCFLSNNDITGGNSGSPVFDKNGRVIGLAFDGNWEAMSGDIAFEPELQRTISVDIRFVLWMIDKWGRCPGLIKELTVR